VRLGNGRMVRVPSDRHLRSSIEGCPKGLDGLFASSEGSPKPTNATLGHDRKVREGRPCLRSNLRKMIDGADPMEREPSIEERGCRSDGARTFARCFEVRSRRARTFARRSRCRGGWAPTFGRCRRGGAGGSQPSDDAAGEGQASANLRTMPAGWGRVSGTLRTLPPACLGADPTFGRFGGRGPGPRQPFDPWAGGAVGRSDRDRATGCDGKTPFGDFFLGGAATGWGGGRARDQKHDGTGGPGAYEQARLRAFRLMVRAYDAARAAVGYLRWREGDAETFVPSLFGGRRRRASESERPEGEPGSDGAADPNASGTQ
jgi:hypothetical protein